MVDEEPLHDLAPEGKKSRFVAFRITIPRRKTLDLEHLEIELVHQQGGLPAVFAPFPAQLAGGYALQFRIEKFNQLSPGTAVACAKVGHQLTDGIGPGM